MQDAYASAQFRIVGSTTGSQILRDNNDRFYLLRFSNSNGGDVALAGVRREGGVNKWVLFAGNTYRTSTQIPVQTDRWYNVELRWNADQTIAQMFVNGAEILEIDVSTSSTAVANAEMGIIYTYQVQNRLLIYGDSFRLSNGS